RRRSSRTRCRSGSRFQATRKPRDLPGLSLSGVGKLASMGNIFLVGMMGAGKTTLGKALARRLGREFVDTDKVLVERTGVSVSTIFEIEGEEGFRRRESAVLAELVGRH